MAGIAAKGNREVFEDGAYIKNKRSGQKIATSKDRGTFAIKVEYMISDRGDHD